MKRLSFIIALFFNLIVFAQEVDFKVEVSKTSLGVNERIRLKFSVNRQGVDDFKLPDLKDFKIVAGPMTGTNFSSINGKMSFEQSYTYTLQPRRQGVLTIGAATANYKGEKITTKPLKITVTKPVEIPKDPNDPNFIASKNIFLVTEISNTNPYVGETISVVYKLYVNVNNVSVLGRRTVDFPTFNGFWSQNIDVQGTGAKDGTYQGTQMRYVIEGKAILIPQKSGSVTIDGMNVEVDVEVPINRRSRFGNILTRSVTYSASSGKRTINVKPLPIANKPANFSGGVGEFEFDVSSSKTSLKANESAQIKVEVSGQGNLKLIELPTIETPNGLERYEPEHKENIRNNSSRLTGKVYDSYTVVPQFRGKYKIPPVSFSYFSLKDKTYKTITSEPLVLNVNEGRAMGDAVSSTGTNKVDVVSTGTALRYISTTTDLTSAKKKKDFLNSNLFYVLLALPLLTIPLGIFIGRKKRARDRDIVGNKRRKADRLARKYLSEAKKQLGHKEAFYIALEKALHNYLKAKLQIETSDISKDKIAEILKEKDVDGSDIKDFIKVLDDSDFARYAPSTNVMMQNDYDRARDIITKLDKQL